MTEPFLGSIQYFAFNFAPTGWHICDGTVLPVASNTALFSLLSTYYGGNGTSNFALPDLRGRTISGMAPAVHYQIGNTGGSETATVPATDLPLHSHIVQMTIGANSNAGNVNSPLNAYPAAPKAATTQMYATTAAQDVQMTAPTVVVSAAGSGSPFNSLSPYLALTCCICMTGYYPPRN